MKTSIIFNPGAGQRNARREMEKALGLLAKRGWEVAQRETRGKGDALRYAQELVSSGYDPVIVAGEWHHQRGGERVGGERSLSRGAKG